jgi:uncharacterized membrane protein YhiD involved in acid resistance
MFTPENFFNLTTMEISSVIIVFDIMFAFVLGLFIGWTYKKTHTGISYSSTFVTTIVLMDVIAAVVMLVIQNNLVGAVGLIGAFSFIRFRTIIKDTRDIAFLFFSLAIGVAVGTSNYPIAIWATLLVSAMIFALNKFNFGSMAKGDFILTFILPAGASSALYDPIFSEFLDHSETLHVKSLGTEKQEHAFEIKVHKNKSLNDFIARLRAIPAIESEEIISSSSSVEY